MRKMIVVGAVLAIASAHAAEELQFGDVNYFIKQGQINLSADVNSVYNKNTINGTSLVNRGVVTNTTAAYAFSDKLNAFVGLSYAYDNESRDLTTQTNEDFSNDGFANPALGVNYRLFNQNEAMYNFDLGAVARIGVQDAEAGSSTGRNSKDGNFATGRDSLELNARMGRKWNEANEWQLAGGVVYNAEGNSTNRVVAGADQKLTEKSSVDGFIRTTYQYRPINEFMTLLSLQATQVADATSKIKSGGNIKSQSHLDIDFNFIAKYLITDNFIAKFKYAQGRNSDIKRRVSGASSNIEKRREDSFGLGVEFLF